MRLPGPPPSFVSSPLADWLLRCQDMEAGDRERLEAAFEAIEWISAIFFTLEYVAAL
eukprot:COSAG05_NODE_500_length_9234_cov_107.281664_4_plen_57_part_00